MKKQLRIFVVSSLVSLSMPSLFAADLVQVYNDALKSDPTYLAATSTYFSAMQNVPIQRSVLMPQLIFGESSSGTGFLSKTQTSGSLQSDDTYSQKGYGFKLSLSQQLFNFPAFETLKQTRANVKAAAATYYAAAQNLMVRVSNAYFAVLEDEDVVRYTKANVKSNKRSLDQAQKQYKVGLKTLTDVYTSQAAYSSAVSQDVSAENTLATDKENLRAITNKEYEQLAKLSDKFPLASPDPKKIDEWVRVAVNNNWSLKSSNYTMQAAMDEIKIQWGGHLPTLALNASYSDNYYYKDSNSSAATGSSRTTGMTASLDFELPLFEGGLVTASAKQAKFDYQTAVHNMELEHRTVVTDTRQDYLNVISGISSIKADKSSIQSNENALKGLEAGYKVGTQTMVDVLNQQSLLFQAQQAYATDRYSYVNNLIHLKSDTGTLSIKDLEAINGWLENTPEKKGKSKIGYSIHSLSHQYLAEQASEKVAKTGSDLR